MTRRDPKRQIWKFPIVVNDETVINIPNGFKVLHIDVQRGVPCMWVELENVDAERSPHTFYVIGTGHPMPEDAFAYLGTFQILEGQLVFHVYQKN